MIEEDPCNCSKPTSFQTVGESIGCPCPFSLAITGSSLTPLQGTAWLGRFQYKQTPGLYSTPERNKTKKNPYLAFPESLCTRAYLRSSRAEQFMGTDYLGHLTYHSQCVDTPVALNKLPGPATALCIHPDFSRRHSWSPYFVAVIQVRF